MLFVVALRFLYCYCVESQVPSKAVCSDVNKVNVFIPLVGFYAVQAYSNLLPIRGVTIKAHRARGAGSAAPSPDGII